MGRALRLLLIEDSDDDADLVLRALRRGGFDPMHERVQTRKALLSALESGREWDVVLSDYTLPRFSGPDAFLAVSEKGLDIPFIIISGTVGEETAVGALKLGIHDYLLKDNLTRLVPAIERELRERSGRLARKRAESDLRSKDEQLRQAQKMEAVGRLAAGVAHDFNNMLSVILSYCELMSETVGEGSDLREDIEEIRKAGRRAASLTRQLLMFSRQEVTAPIVLDLNEVLKGMGAMLPRIIGEDVDLYVSPAMDLGAVKIDPSHVEQVIMNLVVNARDAMPKGGKLTIETQNVTFEPNAADTHFDVAPGRYIMLSVSDSGVGMDTSTQMRIFEPFFTTKPKGKGTGLGLSTVFGIVKQAGGAVWVYSEVGVGTTFKVYLPRCDRTAEPQRSQLPPKSLGGTETILLVEDEEQVRRVTSGILRRRGYEVLEARDVRDAVALHKKHKKKIDLLLTDVVMPEMGGPELASRLEKDQPGIRVLYMSGYTDDSVVRHGVLESEVAFVQKPITPELLARKVRETLDEPAR